MFIEYSENIVIQIITNYPVFILIWLIFNGIQKINTFNESVFIKRKLYKIEEFAQTFTIYYTSVNRL